MTQDEWDACADPWEMLGFLRGSGGLSGRKARLFAVACCRRIWRLLPDETCRHAVSVAERFADGLASDEELATAYSTSSDVYASIPTLVGVDNSSAEAASDAARPGEIAQYAGYAAREALDALELTFEPDEAAEDPAAAEGEAQLALLRDVIGNPFRPTAVDPAWLGRHRDVARLAQAAYDERLLPEGTLDNARLAILADALEEGGYPDAEALAHLRSPGPHVRGCFALDAVLGRS